VKEPVARTDSSAGSGLARANRSDVGVSLVAFGDRGAFIMSEEINTSGEPQPEQGEQLSREELARKKVFTTGEAAALCGLSQQTVIRCFDAGRLTGFKVPGSKFRRIPREELIRFMKANNLPCDVLQDSVRRVLAVDDDRAMLALYEHAFRRDGNAYELQTAENGYDAGLLTERFRPDLLILDYQLPDINGIAVCKRVRSAPHLNSVRILCVSGIADQAAIDGLMAAGADAFLAKPFDVRTLVANVERVLGVQSAA
jgi:excisionase family DNA binding protein